MEKVTFTTSEIMQKLYYMNRSSRRQFLSKFPKESQKKLKALFEIYKKDPDAIRFGNNPQKEEVNVTPK